MVKALDLQLKVQFRAVPVSANNLRQAVHKHVPLSPSSIIQYQSKNKFHDWECNHRPGIRLARHHRLWFIHVLAHGLRKER